MTRTRLTRPSRSVPTHAPMVLFGCGVLLIIVASVLPTTMAQDQQRQQRNDQAYASLSCDATLLTNGSNNFEDRYDMELEESPPTSTPSQSPSLSMPCSDPFSNPRGSYTSSKVPCVISFHNNDGEHHQPPQNPDHQRWGLGGSSSSRTADLSTYYHGTSRVCETENKIGEAKQYVSAWPDECVGDFSRCYDLSNPNHFLCRSLTQMLEGLRDLRRLDEVYSEEPAININSDTTSNSLLWTTRGLNDALVPFGTTHISVDCTIDKEALLESYQQQIYFKQQIDLSPTQQQTLFVVITVLVAVLIVVYAIAKLVVQPIVGAIVSNNNNNNNRQPRADRDCGGDNRRLVSLVSQTSDLGIETTEADGYDDEDDQEEGGFHGREFLQQTLDDDIQIEIGAYATDSTSTPQLHHIPTDFDAVPIVPATIISMEAIHVDVIQDGLIYYP